MNTARRLTLAQLADFLADKYHHVTPETFNAAAHRNAIRAAAREVAAELLRVGFASGYAFADKARPDLLLYENWLHRMVRDYCEARPRLTLAGFLAAHPDIPNDGPTRREIVGMLGRLGYVRAYVRL